MSGHTLYVLLQLNQVRICTVSLPNFIFTQMRSRSNVRELSRSRSVSPIDDEFASPRPLIEVEKPTSDETASKSAGKDQNEIENLTSSQASDNEVRI